MTGIAGVDCEGFLFSSETGAIDEACVKNLVSTALGVAIPLGALGLKLPQVIMRTRLITYLNSIRRIDNVADLCNRVTG